MTQPAPDDDVFVVPRPNTTGLAVLKDALYAADRSPQLIHSALAYLQKQGLSAADLRVHVERLRALSEATNDLEEVVEEQALAALDMIEGLAGPLSLKWNATELAQIHLARILNPAALRDAFTFALRPNDLLPPRPTEQIDGSLAVGVVEEIGRQLSEGVYRPERADVFHVPKARMTTRPASLLAPVDRVIYEALAGIVFNDIERRKSASVFSGTRSTERTNEAEAHALYANSPRTWTTDYVVATDIESFFESVSFARLADTLAGQGLARAPSFLRALKLFLTAVTGADSGLPQGPLASEVFATAFLFPLDAALSRAKHPYARYVDDLLIGCRSVQHARSVISHVEDILAPLGLRLNGQKTRVMKRETYIANLDTSRVNLGVARLRERALDAALQSSERDEALDALLEELNISEQTMWDIFYHGTVDIDDVLAEHREELLPPLVDSYADYFHQLTEQLAAPTSDTNFASLEKDLRESVAFLTAGERVVELEEVSSSLRWFPRLAPVVAKYLASVSDQKPHAVAQQIQAWLSSTEESDYVIAWMAHATQISSPATARSLIPSLREAARKGHPLTRASTTWALDALGALDDETLRIVADSSSRALRAEIYFGGLQSRQAAWPLLE